MRDDLAPCRTGWADQSAPRSRGKLTRHWILGLTRGASRTLPRLAFITTINPAWPLKCFQLVFVFTARIQPLTTPEPGAVKPVLDLAEDPGPGATPAHAAHRVAVLVRAKSGWLFHGIPTEAAPRETAYRTRNMAKRTVLAGCRIIWTPTHLGKNLWAIFLNGRNPPRSRRCAFGCIRSGIGRPGRISLRIPDPAASLGGADAHGL